MRLLLDTNAWLFAAAGNPQLSSIAKDLINQPDSTLFLSSCSLWEFMVLHRKGRFTVKGEPVQWASASISNLQLHVLPIDAEVAFQSELLEDFHGDPGDRFIVATSIIHKLPLITSDGKIQKWAGVQTIW